MAFARGAIAGAAYPTGVGDYFARLRRFYTVLAHAAI
jgi:hypothetical protein